MLGAVDFKIRVQDKPNFAAHTASGRRSVRIVTGGRQQAQRAEASRLAAPTKVQV